jgi:hypothetical protein
VVGGAVVLGTTVVGGTVVGGVVVDGTDVLVDAGAWSSPVCAAAGNAVRTHATARTHAAREAREVRRTVLVSTEWCMDMSDQRPRAASGSLRYS